MGKSENPSPKVQVRKSKSESPSPKVQVRKSKSESPSPKVQVRKSKSKIPSPKVQVRKSKSESPNPEVQVRKSKSESPRENPRSLSSPKAEKFEFLFLHSVLWGGWVIIMRPMALMCLTSSQKPPVSIKSQS